MTFPAGEFSEARLYGQYIARTSVTFLAGTTGAIGQHTIFTVTGRVHVVVLQPFDLQQSGDYLHTRLNAAGLVGDSPFSASVIACI